MLDGLVSRDQLVRKQRTSSGEEVGTVNFKFFGVPPQTKEQMLSLPIVGEIGIVSSPLWKNTLQYLIEKETN